MKRWDLLRSALVGGAFGAAYGLFLLLTGDGASNLPRAIGQIIGSAAGGAIVFGLIAGARNLIVRAK